MHWRGRYAALCWMATIFVASRLFFVPISSGVSTFSFRGDPAAALTGQNFDAGTLGSGMPILDPELLRNDLGRSLWYLHAQPPLFNLMVAGMLRWPGDFALHYQWLNWFLALAFYLAVYALMRQMGVGRGFAAGAVILFMLNPNAMWMESAVYYGLPMALILVCAALAWNRALRDGSTRWLAVSALLVVLLPLTRAFFTAPWCAAVLFFFAFTFLRRHHLPARRVVAATLLPFLLVAAFQIKQYALFGQMLGSSWFGCNLASMTAGMREAKQQALAAGRVSPLVNVYRNDPPETFLRFFPTPLTGVPALDQVVKSTGRPNFNHAVYLTVGRVYLHDTLYLIGHHPLLYLGNVVNSLYIFSGYQPGIYFDRPQQFFSRVSLTKAVAPLVGFPLLVIAIWTAWRRWRSSGDPLVAFLLLNVAYAVAVSCLFEKGEGPLYRFQIDAFLWSFLAMAAEARLPLLDMPRLPMTSPSDVRN